MISLDMGLHRHQGLIPTIGVGYMDSFFLFFSFLYIGNNKFNILFKTRGGGGGGGFGGGTILPTKATKQL